MKQQSHQKVKEIVEKLKKDIPKIFSELKDETLTNIGNSVYESFCSLKRNLDKLFSNFYAFETLSSIASHGYTRLFDNTLSTEEKCDELYSIIFEADRRDPLDIQESPYRSDGKGWKTGFEDKQQDSIHNRKLQSDIFRNKVFDKIVSQLQIEFKPLEKLIKDESLEEYKHHIKEQFGIFFDKYDYKNIFIP